MGAPAKLLVNIDVDDLVRAEAFYTAAFGLTAARRFGRAGVEMIGLAAPIYLLAKAAGTAIAPDSAATRDYRRHWTPVHIDIAVDDLDAAIDRAKAAGAVMEQEARSSGWGRIAMFADPFGHGFCLIEFTEAGYDAIAD